MMEKKFNFQVVDGESDQIEDQHIDEFSQDKPASPIKLETRRRTLKDIAEKQSNETSFTSSCMSQHFNEYNDAKMVPSHTGQKQQPKSIVHFRSNLTENDKQIYDIHDNESSDDYFQNRKTNLIRNKFKHLNKYLSKGQQLLTCADILINMIHSSFNQGAYEIYSFEEQAKKLLEDGRNWAQKTRRRQITHQAYTAKEHAILFSMELKQKSKFIKKFKKLKKIGIFTYQNVIKLDFLNAQVEDMLQTLEIHQQNIALALELFNQQNDIEISKNTKNLDQIMIVLTFITIVFMPAGIIGGTMGINVQVPWQFDKHESLWPWCWLVFASVITMALITVVFARMHIFRLA